MVTAGTNSPLCPLGMWQEREGLRQQRRALQKQVQLLAGEVVAANAALASALRECSELQRRFSKERKDIWKALRRCSACVQVPLAACTFCRVVCKNVVVW